MEFKNYEEFWLFYPSQHSKPSTRAWHFVGTSFVFIFIILAIWKSLWFLLIAPVIAYGIAWFSHLFIEGNKPATFGHTCVVLVHVHPSKMNLTLTCW